MSISQKEISSLTTFANHLLKDNTSGEDIIQDLIVKQIEEGKPFDFLTIKKLVASGVGKHLHHNSLTLDKQKNFCKHDTTRFCKKCEQNLPIKLFYLQRYKNKNEEILSHFCKSCTKAVAKEKYANDHELRTHKIEAAKLQYKEKIRVNPFFRKSKKLQEHFNFLKQQHAILEWRNSA